MGDEFFAKNRYCDGIYMDPLKLARDFDNFFIT